MLRAALVCLLVLGCSRGSARPESDESVVGGSSSSGGGNASSGGNPLAGSGAGGSAELAPLEHDTASGVFVHLFEWRWADVARECETFLGPQGFTAVQVSPASEHAVLASAGYPWWQRYQTVSYALESRSGTSQEFADMVARCRAAGVGIYVDAVLNHMTGQAAGVGSASTKFTKYEYPGLYTKADFHAPTCQIQGADYTDSAEHVQRCELVGLADLDTGSETVQARLAAYLSELLALGVRGFRIDAAKHMAPEDLAAVLAQVTPRADEEPYYFLEVIDYGGEAVHASDYLDVAPRAELDLTEFRYRGVGDAFLGGAGQTLASLAPFLEGATLLAPDRAVVFVNNHDTQRADALFYQDGAAYDLATVFMLASPYGYPSVMSSFGFDRGTGPGRDAGPPSDGQGNTRPVYGDGPSEPDCVSGALDASSQGWICEHRRRSVANMVAFRKAAAGAAVANFWNNGQNQIAFSRDDRGFVAINHEAAPLEQTLQTGLAEGEYCDVLSGDFLPARRNVVARCEGVTVSVGADGSAQIVVPAESALALHVAAQL